MKLLDKYLLRQYTMPLTCCLVGLSMLYLVSGLFDKVNDFVNEGVTLKQIVWYYFLYLFAYADQSNVSFLVLVFPVSVLAAALYSLTRLTRQNELVAMCSCGISMVRLMVPFMCVAVVCSIVAVGIQELVAPRASRLADVFLAAHGKPSASPVIVMGRYYDSKDSFLWTVARVDLSRPTSMTGVELKREFPPGTRKMYPDSLYEVVITNISKAEWIDGRWLFHGAIEQKFHKDGTPAGPPRGPSPVPVEIPGISATPQDVAFGIDREKSQKYVSALTVLRKLHSRGSWTEEDIMQSVDAHRRISMPWACVVAVMLAIPAGIKGGREGKIVGTLLALALFLAFYFMLEAAIIMGKQQLMIWPWLGAWYANIVFFVVGIVMIRRVSN
ncbi:MAG: LptF/LptG family permease [bacterium]